MTSLFKMRTLFYLLIVCIVLNSFPMKANSNQAIVPINITVQGKLIISDAENDDKSGTNPTINVLLKLTPNLNNSIVSAKSSVRIRTNLNSWKLTAQRSEVINSETNIAPEDISLSFTTQSGEKANPNAAELMEPFNSTTDLSQIGTNTATDILVGKSKTSKSKDPDNKNNWFQLTSNYSILPDFFHDTGEWNTVISYSLVSP